MKLSNTKELLKRRLEKDPLRDFFIWWDEINEKDVEALTLNIENAKCEEEIQQFLQNNPKYLIQHLGGGHGRWVLPKKKLGAEYITDFVIGERHSFGFDWQAVELESPKRKMFNKNGDPNQYLNHAIRQIQDWRAWLNRNQNYACRSRDENGLGLTDVTPNIAGLIIIGRRKDIDSKTNDRRRQMVQDLNIEIHSYDFLVNNLKGRIVNRNF
ncbi:MAG: DUF4263 domain-containing protein [Gammaproteobacteria bacterium]|nr:DUF4263 domain-containing protein [Gammaproteobacteria bacterium]